MGKRRASWSATTTASTPASPRWARAWGPRRGDGGGARPAAERGGHAITMNYPCAPCRCTRRRAVRIRGGGTPADAVKLGCGSSAGAAGPAHSGINQGPTWRSTSSIPARCRRQPRDILGVPSIAVSLTSHHSTEFGDAAAVARALAAMVLERGLRPHAAQRERPGGAGGRAARRARHAPGKSNWTTPSTCAATRRTGSISG